MTSVPLGLAQEPPQFTPEYWQKVPRGTIKSVIERVTNKDNGFVEIALKGGMAFMRKKDDIGQLLTANLEVHIETINGQLITGLFVPNVGWAFRMTAEDLADYTKKLSQAQAEHQQRQRDMMIEHVSQALVLTLDDLGLIHPEGRELSDDEKSTAARRLAAMAIVSLEMGPQ